MKMLQPLWRLIWYRPFSYACQPLFMLVCYGERIIFGLTVQAFFNALTAQTQLKTGILFIFLPWFVAIVVRLLVAYIGAFGIVRFEFDTGALLQRNLLQRILTHPAVRSIPGSVGDAINHFRDDTGIVVELLSNLGAFFGLFLYSVTVFIILLRVSVLITLLVFIPLSFILLLAQRAYKNLEKYRTASRNATSNVSGAVGEIFSAVQAIQVAQAEQHVIAHFNHLNNERRTAIVRDRVLSKILDALFSNVTDIGTALILVLAALAISNGQIRPGDLVLFMTYLSLVTDFFGEFGNLLVQQKQTSISLKRLTALLQGGPTEHLVAYQHRFLHKTLSKPAVSPYTEVPKLESLKICNLGYRYPETGHGIAGINLSITRGTLTVITGRIGSGKTTLLQTLLGLLAKDEGEILWNGQPVRDPATFFVPPRSAYTAQVPHLFSGTLRENIRLGLPEETIDLSSAIHIAALDPDIASLPQGLDTQVGAYGVGLSGGQIQRIAAARMIVRTPELLVCDDLSGALDVETEHILWDNLLATNATTCIAVSQRRSLLQRADQVVILKNGSIDAVGSLETLMSINQEMQALWQDQVKSDV